MPAYNIKPELKKVPLKQLRPTQMTVGFKLVEKKRRELTKMTPKKRESAFEASFFPAVRGPGDRFYILDHHHEAVALLQEGADQVWVGLAKDLSALDPPAFWTFLDHYSWVHCYDAKGRRQPFDQIPNDFTKLEDDPYRSFADDIKCQGGFAKPDEPFLDFLWANYFRSHISSHVLKTDPKKALSKGIALARDKSSCHLPGWSGHD